MIKTLRLGAAWTLALVVAITSLTLYAQEARIEPRGINVIAGNVLVSRGYVYSGGSLARDFRTNTAVTRNNVAGGASTAGATYTAAELLSGLITRTVTDGAASGTDALPTAANLIAAIPGVNVVGMSFTTIVDMTATPSFAATINGTSSGVTYSGGCATAISTSDVMLILINITSATAYRAVCLNVNS